MRIFANIIWGLFGGWWAALANVVFGILCYLTVVLIPLGVISFKVAGFMVAPFGKVVVRKEGKSKTGKTLATIMNLLWLPIGLVDALGLAISCLFLAITIIGLPFALQGIKLMNYILWPFGREAISKELHESREIAGELRSAAGELNQARQEAS
jgi:uncharacterized membrane protein YccF (DUF307 family)